MKKIISSIFLITHTLFSVAQWDLVEGPLPYATQFAGLDFINDSTGFVSKTIINWTNYQTEILMTLDYGETWNTVYTHTDSEDMWADRITNIFFIDPIHGWACGEFQPYVLKTDDGGLTWIPHDIEGFVQNHYFEKIEFADENYGIAYGGTHAIESTDGGLTWAYRDSLNGYDIDFLSSCDFISVNGGNIKRVNDCVLAPYQPFPTSNEDPERNGKCIHMIDENNWIMGTQGLIGFSEFASIIYTSDAGSNFQIFDLPFGDNVSLFEFSSPLEGYALVPNIDPVPCTVMKTIDGGQNWYCIETPQSEEGWYLNFPYFDCPSPEVCYGIYGTSIYRTLNGGGEMHPLPTTVAEISSNEVAISPNPAKDIVVVSSKIIIRELEVFNSYGQLMLSEKINSTSVTLDLSTFSQGIYIVTFKSDVGISNQRIVKD
ncbi:MAG: T9SS type A sorting domain-containing protein [Flavobacteriales bacterium]|jgi:hypothetical protein